MDSGLAPAKVNLALHVTGRRDDGLHLLDSLVVFAGAGDRLTVAAADDLSLAVDGPFAAGVPVDSGNLVIRAAQALARAHGVTRGAAIHLTKNLPHAAGIGGGTSDAATAIRLLADLWCVAPLAADDPPALAIGADLPVCLAAPAPRRMSGVGEILAPVAPLPAAALVLVNPGVAAPTGSVFAAMTRRDNPALADWTGGGFADFARWLGDQRNDMETAAITVAPQIARVLALLGRAPGVALARMSGSGASCFGLCPDLAAAQEAARAVQRAEPAWWVTAAPIL